MEQTKGHQRPCVLITGAALRVGKATAQAFFERGCNLVLHYNQSAEPAKALQHAFNQQRGNSCQLVQADLNQGPQLTTLIKQGAAAFGRLDHLINNAACFYPTPFAESKEKDLLQILQTNLAAPIKLAKLAAPHLKVRSGSIVNLIDIYARAGLKEHTFYVASKAALAAATCQLALELSPEIRVNAVAPGAILWPENAAQLDQQSKRQIVENTALKSIGSAALIAQSICYLALDASYSTGSLLNVDGGRRLYI